MKNYLLLSLACLAQVAYAEKKPNILWIVTDDQRADALECWNLAKTGNRESKLGFVSSPNINKLASEGVLFTSAYCNSPLSGPSRATMHTGMYAHHTGMYNFQLKHNEHDRAQPMVPELMREAGYSTAAFGKLGYYIYKYAPKMTFTYPDSHYEQMLSERKIEAARIADFTWPYEGKANTGVKKEVWHYPDGRSVEYNICGKNVKDTPENKAVREDFYKEHEVIIRPGSQHGEIIAGVSTMPTEKTEDGRILEAFCEYLDNADSPYTSIVGSKMNGVDTSKPQFINLGFHFPHTPVMPSKEYREKFADKVYKIPEFEKWEYDKMSPQVQAWYRQFCIEKLSYEQVQQHVRDYYAFCAMGDELIGRAVERFKKYCNDNDQPYLIVLVCGDHGWHLGEQGSLFKMSGFLKSNETAVIVVSSDKDKFPAGKVVTDYAEYVDFAPTFYSAAGYDMNDKRFEFLDGRDLYLTANKKIKPREYVIGEVQTTGGNRAMIRTKDFSFSMRSRKGTSVPTVQNIKNFDVKWPLKCTPEKAEMGLYDLRVDPLERNNVAYDKEYMKLAEWFRNKLGNIVLGDDRLDVVWTEKNMYNLSSFAKGCDDKIIQIPENIIPKVKK